MLRIRKEQMKVFEGAALQTFEDEMMAHGRQFSPKMCEIIGDEYLRLAVHDGIERSFSYGFTNRGPARFFIEMMFILGGHFDTDPQYPWAGEILRDSQIDQMKRSESMYEKVKDYLEKVCGPKNANVRKALEVLLAKARRPIPFSLNDVPAMIEEMTRVYPQKAAYIGAEALEGLIFEGRNKAKESGFTTERGQVLTVVLMFAFGHGCTNDPLYPWIERTWKGLQGVEAEKRVSALESKALTYIESTLAYIGKGA